MKYLILNFIFLLSLPLTGQEIKNYDGLDIRLVSAFVTEKKVALSDEVEADYLIDPYSCPIISNEQSPYNYHQRRVKIDCKQRAEQLIESPILNSYRWEGMMENGQFITDQYNSYTFKNRTCYLAEIILAAREKALEHAQGVGIYHTGTESNSYRTVPLNYIENIGSAQLANGEEVRLIRFLAIATCARPNWQETITFKPYMDFKNDKTVSRVWEKVGAESGSFTGIPGIAGSGNYSLNLRKGSGFATGLKLYQETYTKNLFGKSSQASSYTVKLVEKKTDILTVSHFDNKHSYEMDMAPYASSNSYLLDKNSAQPQAGGQVWVRFYTSEKPVDTDKQKIALKYQIDGGEVEQAGPMYGGNCYAYKLDRCFKIRIPETAENLLSYWFEVQTPSGEILTFNDQGSPYQLTLTGKTKATIRMNEDGEFKTEGDLTAGSTAMLDYHPQNAITEAFRILEKLDYLMVYANISSSEKPDYKVRLPIGVMENRLDINAQTLFMAKKNLFTFKIPMDVNSLTIQFSIANRQYGQLQKEWVAHEYEVELD